MLADDVDAIRLKLREGRFPNEAAISQGVVLRLLGGLGWPIHESEVVWPEYTMEGRRVDFALCDPPGKPRAFIEVKQQGQGLGAERQLFEYAFHRGVQLAVLTDGQEWNFFLPAEAGDYSERRVYGLDLLERSPSDSAETLQRYLAYQAIRSGEAIRAARADYKDVARAREIEAALPIAWQRLVTEEDELLLELVADRVESICGFKPTADQVGRFLRSDLSAKPPSQVPTSTAAGPSTPKTQAPVAVGSGFGLVLLGTDVPCRSGIDALTHLLDALGDRDPTFMDRFMALPKHGRLRRYVARTPEELYPGRPDLAHGHSHRLKSGCWLGTNYSSPQIEQIARVATSVAGLQFGRDVIVRLDR